MDSKEGTALIKFVEERTRVTTHRLQFTNY